MSGEGLAPQVSHSLISTRFCEPVSSRNIAIICYEPRSSCAAVTMQLSEMSTFKNHVQLIRYVPSQGLTQALACLGQEADLRKT